MRVLRLFLFVAMTMSFALPVGEAGAIFLLISPGAAAQGTGEANVARVDDAYASYYNPASLAFQSKTNIAGMHVNWLKSLVPDLYYEYLGFSHPIAGGGIGGHIIFLSLGEQLATDETGNELGNFQSYMWAIDGSYGTKLTQNSALGLGFKLYHQKLADAAVAGEGDGKPYSTDFAFDISYLYRMGENNGDKFRFGFNIANIGPPITFIDEAQADPAPTNMRLGVFANLYEDEFTRVNMMMDMQKLLVAKYPSMDWNDDRIIGDGPGGNSFNNNAGQNEGQYADPWYKAWATAWLDDWHYGGDLDMDGDKLIGGWVWNDGLVDGIQDGEIQSGELIPEGDNEIGEYSNWDETNQTAYHEYGSGNSRSFSDELDEVIINTGFEFWYTENFVLRLGYIYDQEGDIKNPTFGAGIRFEGYGFDFGYTAGEQGHPRSNSLFFSVSADI